MKAEELWQLFCKEKGIDEDSSYDAWAFCGGGQGADDLGRLVLEGKKFGTASLYEEYLLEDEELPGLGEYNILLDQKEDAYAIVKNVEVKVVPFKQVSYYHGFSEGEGERDLDSWREIHKEYWQKDFTDVLKKDFTEDCPVVLEKYSMLYVAPDQQLLPEVKAEDLFEDCYLIEANMRFADQIKAYRQAFLDHEDSMDGCLSLKRMPEPQEWVDYCIEWGNPSRELGENGIIGTLLMCIRKSDEKLVGMIQIHTIPENHPRNYVGHIGYSVHPDERGKGYAKWMLSKGLVLLKYAYHQEKAVISVLPDNAASKATILANKGLYMDTVYAKEDDVNLDRYEIDLSEL